MEVFNNREENKKVEGGIEPPSKPVTLTTFYIHNCPQRWWLLGARINFNIKPKGPKHNMIVKQHPGHTVAGPDLILDS